MTWFAVDDGFHGHHKARRAGLEALGLWTLAGSWCACKRTDGAIPRSKALDLCDDDEAALDRAASALVRAKLWSVTDDGWAFRDWSDYQPTSHELLARDGMRRQQKVEAGRVGGLARASRAKQSEPPHANTDDERREQADPSTAKQNQAQPSRSKQIQAASSESSLPSRPVPSRPDPAIEIVSSRGKAAPTHETTPEPDPERTRAPRRGTACPEDTEPAVVAAWLDRHRIPAAHPEVQRFLDYHRAKGTTSKSWPASWRTWLANADRFAPRARAPTNGGTPATRGGGFVQQPEAEPAWTPQSGFEWLDGIAEHEQDPEHQETQP